MFFISKKAFERKVDEALRMERERMYQMERTDRFYCQLEKLEARVETLEKLEALRNRRCQGKAVRVNE